MTDNELRGIVLQKFYDLRHETRFVDFELLRTLSPENAVAVSNICEQLDQHGLIDWKSCGGISDHLGGMGRITARGSDVIEKTVNSPITITLNSTNDHRISVNASSNSSVQVGNNNNQTLTLNLDSLNSAIEKSAASPSEKIEAKSVIAKIADSKLLQTALGVIVTTAIKSFGG